MDENKKINDDLESTKVFNIFEVSDDEKPLESDDTSKGLSMDEIKTRSSKKQKDDKKKKSRRGLRAVIWALIVVILAVALACGIIFVASDVMGVSGDVSREVYVTIPKGSSTKDIADILKDNGLINFPTIFRAYSKLKNADGGYQYGYYTLSSTGSYEDFIDELQTIGAHAEEKEVTIPEGSNVRDICAIMEKSGLCTEKEFLSAMSDDYSNYDFINEIPTESVIYDLEGYLYPETYRFAYVKDDGKENAHRAIVRMLDTLEEKVFTNENREKAKKLGYNMHEILTMASIVQLEAGGSPDEMSSVAQVFYKRLKWDDAHLLGSTPTSEYFSDRYDTNKYEGLPPGPLDSPSLASINAALNPNTKLDATYFVTDKAGKFYYTNSLSEHESIIAQLKREGNWEY